MRIAQPLALVLCGGASRGALEVGFYLAVEELGLRVDLVLGASIGALNGAYIAAGMRAKDLARLWFGFRRRQAIAPNWKGLLHPRRHPGLYTLDPLRALLRRTLPATRFEELPIPLMIVTTDLQLGKAVQWSGTGDIIEPLIASLSLPVFFPPVRIGDHQHVDGGVANNVPIEEARALGARQALMIECVCCGRAPGVLAGFLRVLGRSLSIAFDCRYNMHLERSAQAMEVHVVRPVLQREIGLLDFSRTSELIDAGYRDTLRYFANRGRPGTPQIPLTIEAWPHCRVARVAGYEDESVET